MQAELPATKTLRKNPMNKTLFSAAAVAATLSLLPLTAQAQTTIAADNAGNAVYANGFAGLNGGTGFGVFNVVTSNPGGGNAGTFVASASESEDGSAGSIDTNGKSFGTYANGASSGPGDPSVTISRAFNVGPTIGGTFALDFVTGYNDGANGGGHDFVSLTNAAGTFGTFGYQSGNAYLFNGTQIQGLNYTTGALHLVYGITSATTYSLKATGAVTFSGTGTFAGPVTGFQVQQANANNGTPDHNAYFNNLVETASPAAVPEASSSIGFGVLLALGGLSIIARKRNVKA